MASDGSEGISKWKVFGIAVACALLAAAGTAWWLVSYVFPSRFEAVELSAGEQRVLDAKLRRIGVEIPPRRDGSPRGRDTDGSPAPLEPEPYREDPEGREIGISERELNALLAHNTNLAERLAIDLSDDLASAKLLIPVDPEFPVLGGRILRVHAGVELRMDGGRPVVILRGISLMGVPLPNAWLGNLKHVDLVERFSGPSGFWAAFAAGIADMRVREGELRLVLKQ